MLEIMPVKINTNPNTEGWDYDQSVVEMKATVINWRKVSTEMLEELLRARTALSRRGTPYLKTVSGVTRKKTWNDYCLEVGLTRRSVNRWLDRYLNPEREIETPVKEKVITSNVLIKSVNKKDGIHTIKFVCPECDEIHSMEVELV